MTSCSQCAKPAKTKGMCHIHYCRDRYRQQREQRIAESRQWALDNTQKRRAISAKYREANREKTNAAVRASGKKNGSTKTAWVERNRQKVRQTKRAWVSRNPGYVRAMKSRVRLATPTWADRAAIIAVYEQARLVSKSTGIPHDVDHVVPIAGKLVCGLHVSWNLCVVPATLNRKKGNRFEIG